MQDPVDKTPSAEEANIFTLTGTLKHMASFGCSHVIFSGRESEHCDKKDIERGACCNSCWARRSAQRYLPQAEALIKAFRAVNTLKDASTSLVAKMDVVHESPDYKAVWGLAANHAAVGAYKGPTYEEELKQLRVTTAQFQQLLKDLDVGVVS